MNLYKMITVLVTFDKDTYEEKHNTYTQLKLKEDHLAVTTDAYITLHGHQLQGCYQQGSTYYCESLHFTSHTLEHNCASAIYFKAPSEQVVEKCRFVYYHNYTPEPKILETQALILLSNLPRPWQLVCGSQTEHLITMAGSPYTIIKREDLCSCGIIAQHYFLHKNMIRCSLPNNEVTLYYVHNKILLDFHVKGEEKLDHTSIKLLLEPPQTSIKDLQVIQGKFPKVLVCQTLKNTPVELPTAIEAIDTDQKYYETQEALAQSQQTVDNWLQRADYLNTISLIFALIANLILLILTITIILGYKYRRKLALMIATLSQAKPLKTLKIEGLYTTKAPTPPLPITEDNTSIIRNMVWVLIAAITLIIIGLIFKKIYKLHCYRSSVAHIFWPCCMRRDYIRNTFTTDVFIEVVHLLTNKIVYAHLLTLPIVPTSLRYRGSITLENLTLTNYYCYSVLDIDWESFHLYIHHDPIILPKRGYIYGFQPNLLTDFKAPGQYQIQFMASYLDLCTPIPPANMHDAIPSHTKDTRL